MEFEGLDATERADPLSSSSVSPSLFPFYGNSAKINLAELKVSTCPPGLAEFLRGHSAPPLNSSVAANRMG